MTILFALLPGWLSYRPILASLVLTIFSLSLSANASSPSACRSSIIIKQTHLIFVLTGLAVYLCSLS